MTRGTRHAITNLVLGFAAGVLAYHLSLTHGGLSGAGARR